MSHQLWEAAEDLRLPPEAGVVFVTEAPERWDETLDVRLPVLISSSVGPWETLGSSLWESGCPPTLSLRLVEPNGEVHTVEWVQERLSPAPKGQEWVLALGWSHPEEGWRARRPLHGRSYIVTRAAGQGSKMQARLEESGARVYAIPTIAFVDPDDFSPWVRAVSQMETFDWLLFTSPNGVDSFISRLRDSGRDLRCLAGAKFGCIGPSTAKALAAYCLRADLVPEEFVAEGLLASLAEIGVEGQKILLPRAQVARDVLPEGLRALGAEVLVAPVYKTVPPPVEIPPEVDARVLFTSSSTVTNWVEATSLRPPCFCIGPITEGTARDNGLEILGVASTYTIDGLIDSVLDTDGR